MPSYKATLEYLYAQLPMFQRIGPAAYKKDLGNTLALCAHLGNPHRQFRSIHIAGTNGKGSVSHMLAAICQAAGLKTGLYTSPHYKDFRERIKIDGTLIPRQRIVAFVEEHRTAIESIQPSFFEICVAMAFDHFAREKVDIAIVEVGLGGRLDSTNVITPLLSVITNISFDHMNMLGDTLPQIAGEKAGIIKPGIPVVVGETHPESAPVFERTAQEKQAPLTYADRHIRIVPDGATDWTSSDFRVFENKHLLANHLRVEAAGPYLARNLATAIQAWLTLNRSEHPDWLPVAPAKDQVIPLIGTGLHNLRARTRFIGRWQVIGRQPVVLCDSAHNEAGLTTVLGHLEKSTYPQVHLVMGFVNDKSVDGVLKLFPAGARYYFAKANIPRGLDAGSLRDQAAKHGLHGRAYTSVRQALKAARRAAGPDDLILVTGSIFVVAEVLPERQKNSAAQ
ncbi:MAG: bifunctional folylpolyglutamate synthase/dihydrofolate synthase [Bacteroidetes bacterium]|nr:MAG: bifunctional folylpolyglutamate synthase/dihydrofolate synthase [Bacteroidota bacterium]